MSGELRKPHTLMRLRHWLCQLLANVEHCHERHHPEAYRLVAPHRRVVSAPDSVLGDTGPRAGRCVRPPGLPGRQDLRTRLTAKNGAALTQVKCAAPALGAGSLSTASRDDRLRCRYPMLS